MTITDRSIAFPDINTVNNNDTVRHLYNSNSITNHNSEYTKDISQDSSEFHRLRDPHYHPIPQHACSLEYIHSLPRAPTRPPLEDLAQQVHPCIVPLCNQGSRKETKWAYSLAFGSPFNLNEPIGCAYSNFEIDTLLILRRQRWWNNPPRTLVPSFSHSTPSLQLVYHMTMEWPFCGHHLICCSTAEHLTQTRQEIFGVEKAGNYVGERFFEGRMVRNEEADAGVRVTDWGLWSLD